MKFAFWLLPDEPASASLQAMIADLAARYEAASFAPHLTLCSLDCDSSSEAVAAARRAAEETATFTLGSAAVRFSEQFTKSLYIRCQPVPELDQLRRSLGAEMDAPFEPHVSLLYQQISETEKSRLATSLEIPVEITFDRVATVTIPGRVTTSEDVRAFRVLEEAKLGGGSVDAPGVRADDQGQPLHVRLRRSPPRKA